MGFSPKSFDFVVLIVYLAVATVTSLHVFGEKPQAEFVEIDSPSGKWLYSLSKDMEVRVDERDGTCLISIHNRSARVISSDCPENICIKTGSISISGQWIACLPHRIFINIKGSKGRNPGPIDAVSY